MNIYHCPKCNNWIEEDPFESFSYNSCPECGASLRLTWKYVKCCRCGSEVTWNRTEGGWFCKKCKEYPDDVHFYMKEDHN